MVIVCVAHIRHEPRRLVHQHLRVLGATGKPDTAARNHPRRFLHAGNLVVRETEEEMLLLYMI